MIFSLNGIETANYFEFREWANLNFPLHCHYAFEVVFVKAGCVSIEIEKEKYMLSKGESIAIMPFEKHSFTTENGKFSSIFIFQISPKLISNWDACFGGKTLKNPCCLFSDALLSEIYNDLKNTNGNLIKLNAVFFKIMSSYLVENELVAKFKTDDICLDALKYIGNNYEKNITLKDAAAHLNVSSVYLSRVFAKKIRFKFVDCINSFRIQKALSLLTDPNKNITEICYECGFGSVRQFNRYFLKTMLCTPSEYRKKEIVVPY